jgi:hypothetical protein
LDADKGGCPERNVGAMPRETGDLPPPPSETPAGLRQMAARARRLAGSVFDQKTIDGLTEFAEELEARAAALETAIRYP